MNPLNRLLRFLFRVPEGNLSPDERELAEVLLWLNWVMMIGSAISFVYIVLPDVSTVPAIVILIFEISFFLSMFVVIRTYRVNLAVYMTVAYTVIVPIMAMRLANDSEVASTLTLILPVAMAGALLRHMQVNLVGAILLTFVFVDALLDVQSGKFTGQFGFQQGLQVAIILLLGLSIESIFASRRNRLISTSESDVTRLEGALQLLSGVDNQTSEDDLLRGGVNYLRSTFGFDVVQVYVADEEGQLTHIVRVGMRDLDRSRLDEPLSFGTTHPIADAARLKTTIVIGPDAPINRRAYQLPGVRYSLAVPIVLGQNVLAVVDIQNTADTPFQPESIKLISLFARDLAAIWSLVHSMSASRQMIHEQDRMISRLESQMAQFDARTSVNTSSAWADYIGRTPGSVVGYDMQSDGVLRLAKNMPEYMRRALESGEIYTIVEGDEKHVSVPIQVRGEFIGSMTFSIPADQNITERQHNMAQTIAVRLGSALENRRLLEQTQEQAERERQASEVAGLLIRATDIDSLLRLAADSFNDTLGAVQTRIYIEPQVTTATRVREQDQSPNGNKNGHGEHA